MLLRPGRTKECPWLSSLLNVISVTWFQWAADKGSSILIGKWSKERKDAIVLGPSFAHKKCAMATGRGGSSGCTRPTRLTFKC